MVMASHWAACWLEQTVTIPRAARPTLHPLDDLGPLPYDVTVHLDAVYDSDTSRALLDERGLHGRIAHKGEKAPIQASQRWHVETTHAWQNAFHRLTRCYERRATVIDAFFDLADTIITVRSLIRRGWTTHCWDQLTNRRPQACPVRSSGPPPPLLSARLLSGFVMGGHAGRRRRGRLMHA